MSASPLTTTVRMIDQDADGVYFCENSWHTSYSRCVDEDSSSLTEQEIAEFIRQSNTSLYEKLNSVRIASSHLPCGDDDHHGEPGDTSCDENDQIIPEAIEEAPTPLFRDADTKFTHTAGPSDADCPSETDLTYTSSPPPTPATEPIVIAGRYHFTFYQHCEPGTVYCCSSPTCPNPRNVIPVGNYFGIIRDQGPGEEKNDQLTDYNRTAYCCLDCLDEVVDREEHQVQGQKMMVPHQQLVDGAQPDRGLILHKALEMYPELQEKDFFFVRVPDDEAYEIKPGEASNSKRVIRFRRQKQLETHRITQELREQRFTYLYRMYERETKPDPSGLRILPPLESQPYRERYKKQGLEWVDRLEGSESRKTRRDEDGPAATNNHTSNPDLEMVEMPVCYCREPADQGPMLRCRSASCMLGPIHFRCSGLNQLPLDAEDYWCDYCVSDSTGDTERIGGNGVLANCTSVTENVLNVSHVETDDGDFGITASGEEEEEEEEESEDECDTVQSAHGFVAVNHVSPHANG